MRYELSSIPVLCRSEDTLESNHRLTTPVVTLAGRVHGPVLLWGVFALSAMFLAGCATAPGPSSHQAGTYKLGKPYYVHGVRYIPRVDTNYNRTGVASWYGKQFHGKKTANGEIFNMNAISAAHPTLPLPTNVRVTNLENGRALIVRINDRGPFANGRIIDLSRRAAQELGFLKKGTAKVRVEYVGRASLESFVSTRPMMSQKEREATHAVPTVVVSREELPPPPGTSAPGVPQPVHHVTGSITPHENTALPTAKPRIGTARVDGKVTTLPVTTTTALYIQAGAFVDPLNANRLREELGKYGPVKVRAETIGDRQFFRVWLGPLHSVSLADQKLNELIYAGHTDARIVVD